MDRSVSGDSATAKPPEAATRGRQTFENIRFQMIANIRSCSRRWSRCLDEQRTKKAQETIMAPHRAKQQRNRSDLPEALVFGNINVCRTMAIRTTVAPYSRHGFTLISRSFRAWDRSHGHSGTSLSGRSKTNFGEIFRWLNGSGGESQCSQSPRGRLKVGLAQRTYNTPSVGKVKRDFSLQPYCNFAYSALASFRIGISGSASFQSVRKSWYALFAFAVSPAIA
jgi:hypothetical protein